MVGGPEIILNWMKSLEWICLCKCLFFCRSQLTSFAVVSQCDWNSAPLAKDQNSPYWSCLASRHAAILWPIFFKLQTLWEGLLHTFPFSALWTPWADFGRFWWDCVPEFPVWEETCWLKCYSSDSIPGSSILISKWAWPSSCLSCIGFNCSASAACFSSHLNNATLCPAGSLQMFWNEGLWLCSLYLGLSAPIQICTSRRTLGLAEPRLSWCSSAALVSVCHSWSLPIWISFLSEIMWRGWGWNSASRQTRNSPRLHCLSLATQAQLATVSCGLFLCYLRHNWPRVWWSEPRHAGTTGHRVWWSVPLSSQSSSLLPRVAPQLATVSGADMQYSSLKHPFLRGSNLIRNLNVAVISVE